MSSTISSGSSGSFFGLGPFQKHVTIVACCILLLVVVVIGYFMREDSLNSAWPPSVANCPDYWEDTDGTGAKCVNTHDIGSYFDENEHKIKSIPVFNTKKKSKYCEIKRWMDNVHLTWDGITDVDPCSDAFKKQAVADKTW